MLAKLGEVLLFCDRVIQLAVRYFYFAFHVFRKLQGFGCYVKHERSLFWISLNGVWNVCRRVLSAFGRTMR